MIDTKPDTKQMLLRILNALADMCIPLQCDIARFAMPEASLVAFIVPRKPQRLGNYYECRDSHDKTETTWPRFVLFVDV